jgi:hypothetical protein
MAEVKIEEWIDAAARKSFEAFNDWLEKLLRFSEVKPANTLRADIAEIIARAYAASGQDEYRRGWCDAIAAASSLADDVSAQDKYDSPGEAIRSLLTAERSHAGQEEGQQK